ncbi:MAG: FG-GAP-like repeat-containing protein [Bacteroidota bacterium]
MKKQIIFLIVICIVLLNASPSKSQNTFTEQTAISLPGVQSSSLAWGDYNNDGFLDILICGSLNGSSSCTSKIFKNNGDNTFTEQTGIAITGVYSGYVAWGDYNNDGYLDFIISGYTSTALNITKIYKNNGNNTFTEQTGISITGVRNSSIAWGDYNNDGWLDILLTGYNGTGDVSKIFKNNGNGTFTEQTGIVLTGVEQGSVAWGDYNNDGLLDILLIGYVAERNFISKIYKNNGDNTFSLQTGISFTGVVNGSAVWGDYNNDGWLDVLLTGNTAYEYITKVYKNNGNNTFTEQTGISLTGAKWGSIAWGDYNNDGWLDILVSGYTGPTYITKLYKNNANNTFTEQTGLTLPNVIYSSVGWADYDNDGALDILISGYTGSAIVSKIFKNSNTVTNTAPLAPTNLQSSAIGNNITFKWDKATDGQTPQNGLNYNLYLYEANQTNYLKSPQSDTNNGFRRIASIGNIQYNTNGYSLNGVIQANKNYRWSVQSIDAGFKGSNFASYKTYPEVIVIAQPVNDTVCANNDAFFTFNLAGNVSSYHWYFNGNEIPGTNSYTLNIPNATTSNVGNYYCKAYFGTDSVTSNTVSVIIASLPVPATTISGMSTVCQGVNNIAYTVPNITNASTYIWTLADGTSITSVTNSIMVNYSNTAVSGNITVKGHSQCGDGDISTLAVTVNAMPATPIVGNITQPNCTNATGNIELSGLPASGMWNLTPSNISGVGTSTSIIGFLAGTYNFKVVNNLGCSSLATSNVVLNAQPVTPTAPIVSIISQPNCASATGSILVNGLPSSGTWTLNPGSISGTGSSLTINGVQAGNYSYTVTNESGCLSAISNSVSIIAGPTLSNTPIIGNIIQTSCTATTGSIALNGLPANGTWILNPGNISGSGTSTIVSGLAPGNYAFTVTNASGCTSQPTASTQIVFSPTFFLNVGASSNSICKGASVNLSTVVTNDTLLKPDGAGGFELGTTLAANGWSTANSSLNLWYTSNAAPAYSGSRGAHITTNNNNYNYSTSLILGQSRTSYLYRDVIIPSGSTNLSLDFYWKGKGENGFDRLLVFTAPTSVIPVANNPMSPSTNIIGATLIWTQPNYTQTDYTLATVALSNSLAGTTVRLMFVWQDNASNAYPPPAAIDNISIISRPDNNINYSWTSIPAGFSSNLQNPVGVVPNESTQYIATASFGNCILTNSTSVVVNNFAPTGNESQSFCYGTTVSGLVVSGSGIKWYDAATGGNLLSTSDVLIDGNSYYASQTVNGCESENRLKVVATVINPPTPVGNAIQSFNNAATVADLVATGSGIKWYDVATGGNMLLISNSLINGNTYYASQNIGTCVSQNRLAVYVTINTMAPVVQTNSPNINNTVITFNGNVLNNGGDLYVARGFVYALHNNPSLNDPQSTTVNSGTGSGTFSSIVSLTTNTIYYVRAWATNGIGTSYGDILAVKTGNWPWFTVELRNDVQVSPTEYQFDIYAIHTGNYSTPLNFEMSGYQIGIYVNDSICNGGSFTDSLVLGSNSELSASQKLITLGISASTPNKCLKITGQSAANGQGTIISKTTGTKLMRIRLINSVPFAQAKPNLSFTAINATGYNYPTKVNARIATNSTNISANGIFLCNGLNNFMFNVTVYNLTGGGLYCLGGSPVLISLDGSQTGVNYQLKKNGLNFGAMVAGTGGALTWSVSEVGTYTCVTGATNMNGSAIVSETAPPIGEASQVFCNSGTINDLIANGTDISWYNNASGGNPLLPTDALTNGHSYYATQKNNGCESISRLGVLVTFNINPTAVPTGETIQSKCNLSTIADLVVTGTAIKWYDAVSGGNLISPSNILINGYTYYASQTNLACESQSRLGVHVNISNNQTINLHLFLEGLYDGSVGNRMFEKQDFELGSGLTYAKYGQGIADKIDVELHQERNPFSTVLAQNNVNLSTTGVATFNTGCENIGTYYIAVKNANHIQTWSAYPIPFSNTTIDYNFTLNASNAYQTPWGNDPQVQVATGLYAFFLGDLDQNQGVDFDDFNLFEPFLNEGVFGFTIADFNGNALVDFDDFNLFEPRLNEGPFSQYPGMMK